jgi:polyhydroxyalkanoate synthesis regulator phasin
MADMSKADEESTNDGDSETASPAPRRGPGHRAADARDTAAEMAARAHEISLEAGSKMAGAMRDVIGAAAGFSAFAIESARDLIHYMVRRGQMGQDEGDVLIQQAEAAYIAKHGALPKPEPKPAPPKPIPLGQLPKAVTAPAAAAERALEARAAMRLEPQKPSDKGPPLILRPPTKTASLKAAAPAEKPEAAAKSAAKPATTKKSAAKAAKPAKAPAKAPKAPKAAKTAKAAKPAKAAKAAKPAKAPAKKAAKKKK